MISQGRNRFSEEWIILQCRCVSEKNLVLWIRGLTDARSPVGSMEYSGLVPRGWAGRTERTKFSKSEI